jgi:hypothetical protein
VTQFSGVNESLSFPIKRFERFHEIGERSGIRFITDCLIDWQNLFKFVLLFTCAA